MKEVWMCRWEVIPGNGEQTIQFPTLAAAKQAMREKIAESIDLTQYLSDLEPQVAAFLKNYLSDPQFPQSKSHIPEEYADPERGVLILDSGFIRWDHPYSAYPRMNTNLVLDNTDDDTYSFDFWYERPREVSGKKVKALSISIFPYTDYGTSAYPLMVLLALRKTPQTQSMIAQEIRDSWDTDIDRKSVGRHLQLLQDLGYPVQHCAEGYYLDGEPGEPNAYIQFKPSAYPLMVLQVLNSTPKKQADIIREIEEKFGIKIGRKAVARHLELIQAMDACTMQKPNLGYYRF